jgi:hypothetical protein
MLRDVVQIGAPVARTIPGAVECHDNSLANHAEKSKAVVGRNKTLTSVSVACCRDFLPIPAVPTVIGFTPRGF